MFSAQTCELKTLLQSYVKLACSSYCLVEIILTNCIPRNSNNNAVDLVQNGKRTAKLNKQYWISIQFLINIIAYVKYEKFQVHIAIFIRVKRSYVLPLQINVTDLTESIARPKY